MTRTHNLPFWWRALYLYTTSRLIYKLLSWQVINNESWPPSIKDAPVEMLKYESKESSFGLGHRFFGILPGLVIWSTVFLREHNTVCDQLTEEHPHWTDEQIFQTARNAITGIFLDNKSVSLQPIFLKTNNFTFDVLCENIDVYKTFPWRQKWTSIGLYCRSDGTDECDIISYVLKTSHDVWLRHSLVFNFFIKLFNSYEEIEIIIHPPVKDFSFL